MRGGLEERAEFAFQCFDVGSKGHLTDDEFKRYLNSIVQAAVISNQGNLSPYFKDDLKQFEDSMMEIIKEKKNIAFMDIKNDLLMHDMIKYCDMSDELRTRGETIAKISQTLSESQRIFTGEKIEENPEEFDDDTEITNRVARLSNSSQEMGSSTISPRRNSAAREELNTNLSKEIYLCED